MTRAQHIKQARERNAKAVAARPQVGQSTSVTSARLVDGFRCEIREGDWSFVSDLPDIVGGDNEGPTPGTYGRGALASCLAMGIVGWAAQMDIALDGLSIEIHADWDVRGELGWDNVDAGYSRIRVLVDIESPAPEGRLRELLETAERHSPYIDVFRRANDVEIEARLSRPAAEYAGWTPSCNAGYSNMAGTPQPRHTTGHGARI